MMTNTMPLVQEKKHIIWKKVPIIHMPFYLLEQNLKIHMIMKNAIALETTRKYFSVVIFFAERSEAAEGSRARQAEGRAYDRARELGRRE